MASMPSFRASGPRLHSLHQRSGHHTVMLTIGLIRNCSTRQCYVSRRVRATRAEKIKGPARRLAPAFGASRGGSNKSMSTVRPESPEDVPAIRRVNELAFDGPQEAVLVDALRRVAHPFISVVAAEGDQVVGHICFTPVTIAGGGALRLAMGLAPMGVLPEYQRRGIGSQLVRAGLEECRRLGCEVVVVLGHPEYYPRFGFIAARDKGLRSEYEVPDEAFMVKELKAGALDGVDGLVKYHEAFGAV